VRIHASLAPAGRRTPMGSSRCAGTEAMEHALRPCHLIRHRDTPGPRVSPAAPLAPAGWRTPRGRRTASALNVSDCERGRVGICGAARRSAVATADEACDLIRASSPMTAARPMGASRANPAAPRAPAGRRTPRWSSLGDRRRRADARVHQARIRICGTSASRWRRRRWSMRSCLASDR